MLKKIRLLFNINWICTLKLNYLLPFRKAIKFPIICFGKFSIHKLTGRIIINSESIYTGMIQIGEGNVGIFPKRGITTLNIVGTIVFKGSSRIGKASSISIGDNSILTIGERFTITAKSTIICSEESNITIGKDTLLSWDILIMSNDFHHIYSNETGTKINSSNDIFIGNNTWIGCRSVILKGSVIPNNSVIAASSVISGKLDMENCIYTGMPIKILNKDIYWQR
jgi:acetyltransferase-like isoleucine patch superfamily enzyme